MTLQEAWIDRMMVFVDHLNGDFVVRLGDAEGSNRVSGLNSLGTQTYSIDSAGRGTFGELQGALDTGLAGRLVVPKAYGVLGTAIDESDTSAEFGQIMPVGSIVVLTRDGLREYVQTGARSSSGGLPGHMHVPDANEAGAYSITRDLTGSGALAWDARTMWYALGVEGDYWIELKNEYGNPRLDMFTLGDSLCTTSNYFHVGGMNGLFGITGTAHGVGIGDYSGGDYIRFTDTGGLQIKAGGVNLATAFLPLAGGNLTGNVTADSGVTVDGVDISAFKTAYDAHTHAYLPLSGGNLTGNVTADSGVTVDGVDISAFKTAYDAHTHAYLPLAGGTLTGALTASVSTDVVNLTVKAVGSQTANLTNWTDSSNNVLLSVKAGGDIIANRAQPFVELYASVAYGTGSGGVFTAGLSSLPTAADQRLGSLLAGALDGSTSRRSVGITFWSSETSGWTGGTYQGSHIRFEVTPKLSATRAEVARIENNGNVLIGTTTDGMTAAGSIAIAQDLAHRGSKVGFFNVTPASRPTAYTQTYSTATKTVAAPTAAALTDNSGGSANTTLESIGTTYSQSAIRNNFADLAAMVNKNTSDHVDLLKVVTQIIDDLQALGILQ